MTIHLPDNLESSIRAIVQNGQFPSVDDAMAEAARLLLRQLDQVAQTPEASQNSTTSTPQPDYKPIWEMADDIRKTVPAEEWAKLPADGARQLDHYIYGTPKRPIP